MGKRVHIDFIDFVIREESDDPENARGVKFGDDVDLDDIYGFFNRCRDAANLLFNGKRPTDEDADKPKAIQAELAKLQKRIEEEKRKAVLENPGGMAHAPSPSKPDLWPSLPRRTWDSVRLTDDGSRGGDGPPSKEWLEQCERDKAEGRW